MKPVVSRSLALLAAVTLGACSGSSNGPAQQQDATGFLSIGLGDAPVDDVLELWVEFTGVSVKPRNGPAIDVPYATPLQVDLLTLDVDNSATLLDSEEFPAGAYNWIELWVNASFDSNPLDSYAVTDVGGQEEVEVTEVQVPGPANRRRLRLVSGFTITADQVTNLYLDWDVRRALVDPIGQSGFFLRPAIRVVDMTAYGTLNGTVAMTLVMPPADCSNDLGEDTGNVVYIYEQFDFMATDPDDIDGEVGPVPVATARVSQDMAGDYVYETILSPGDYTVGFTCQAADDFPDSDDSIAILGLTDVSIVTGGTQTIPFN